MSPFELLTRGLAGLTEGSEMEAWAPALFQRQGKGSLSGDPGVLTCNTLTRQTRSISAQPSKGCILSSGAI